MGSSFDQLAKKREFDDRRKQILDRKAKEEEDRLKRMQDAKRYTPEEGGPRYVKQGSK